MRIQPKGIGQVATNGAATIAATIQKVEGYYPGSIAYQNNNPGNLIFVGQPGAVQGPPMAGTPYYFATFPSYDAGYQALLNQIQSYANQGLTIDQMMAKYAPAQQAGNDPTSYANQIATALGVPSSTPVADAIAGTATMASNSGADLSSLVTDDSTDSSSTIDPTTLAVVGGIALAAMYLLR